MDKTTQYSFFQYNTHLYNPNQIKTMVRWISRPVQMLNNEETNLNQSVLYLPRINLNSSNPQAPKKIQFRIKYDSGRATASKPRILLDVRCTDGGEWRSEIRFRQLGELCGLHYYPASVSQRIMYYLLAQQPEFTYDPYTKGEAQEITQEQALAEENIYHSIIRRRISHGKIQAILLLNQLKNNIYL